MPHTEFNDRSAEEPLKLRKEFPQNCSRTSTACTLEAKGRQGSEIWDRQSTEAIFEDAAAILDPEEEKALASLSFGVTVYDARSEDCTLLVASDEFEEMTSYMRSELVGKCLRFLQSGTTADYYEEACFRRAQATGVPFSCVSVKRKKSGELFLCYSDVRGISVATHTITGGKLWFLVTIQADVSQFGDSPEEVESKEALMHRLQSAAATIREEAADDFVALAVADVHQQDSDRMCSSSEWAPIEELEED